MSVLECFCPLYPLIHLFIYPSIYPFIYIHPFIHVSHLPIRMFIFPSSPSPLVYPCIHSSTIHASAVAHMSHRRKRHTFRVLRRTQTCPVDTRHLCAGCSDGMCADACVWMNTYGWLYTRWRIIHVYIYVWCVYIRGWFGEQ